MLDGINYTMVAAAVISSLLIVGYVSGFFVARYVYKSKLKPKRKKK